MAKFNILEAGFSSLDETINFGTRRMGDNCLYEIVTIAEITSSETNKTSNPVRISSQYQGGKMLFSIDKLLRIIKDKNITEVIWSYEFHCIIDTLCVTPCERFMLIGTQDGTITIRALSRSDENDKSQISDEFPLVFEEKLDDCYCGGGYFKKTFFHDDTFYIVTSNGLVKKIVLEVDKEENHFKSEIIYDFQTQVKICAFEYPYLCLEGKELYMLNMKNNIFESDDYIGITTLHAIELYFLAYDNMGNIYRIYPREFLIFCVNKNFPNLVDHFQDVLSIYKSGIKSEVNFLGIRKQEQKEIQLVTYPGSKIVYSIGIQGSVHLLTVEEEVLFFTEIHENNILHAIRLQIIIKTDPEFRLKKLIQKELFDDAEVFAKTFNISPEFITQAKAQNIVDKIICTTKDIDQLLDILDTVDDQLFKLNCCESVSCKSGTDTRRVLSYGAFMDITVKDWNKNKDSILPKKKISCDYQLHRFDTFMQIYDSFDHHKWKYFVECDFIDEIKILLQQGEIRMATQMFSRLDRITIETLTAMKIEQIASMLNKNLLSKTAFLNVFIPISLKYVPDSVVTFIKWLYDGVFQLERQYGEFPESAIKFVEDVIKLMDLTAPAKKHLHMENLQDPTCLLKALKDLKIFLHNFGIRFPLSDYLANPFIIIRTLLNANHNIPNFEALMTDFLCPLILKNNHNMDLVLIEEIENLLVYEEEYWINMVSVLLKFITSVDKKLNLAYKILEITDIPWSDSVKNVAKMTCQLAPNNPVAEKISERLNNEQILIILRKYDIHNPEFETLDDKIFYFNRMIYLDRASLVEDIHNLCMDDVKVRQEADLLLINKLIVKLNYDKAMKILDENKPEIIMTLCKDLLSRCLYFAETYTLPKKFRDPYFSVLNLIWNRFKKHSTSLYDKSKFEDDYKTAYAIYGISEYFKTQIHFSDLFNRRKRDKLLGTLIQQVTESYSEDDTSSFDTFVLNCKRLSRFFDIDLEEVYMKCLVKGKNFSPFLRLGQHLLDSSECPKLLSCWALYLLKYLKTNFMGNGDESLSNVLEYTYLSKNREGYLEGIRLAKKLAIKAMMNASPEDHGAVMEVIRWINTCFYLTNKSNQLNMDRFQICHSSNTLRQGVQSIEAIKSSFNIYCTLLGSCSKPNMGYLTYFTTNIPLSEDQFNKEIKQLTWNINSILEDGQYLTCYNIFKTIQAGFLCNPNMPKETLNGLQSLMKTKWLPKTLDAVLSYRCIDKTLLLNLMLLYDNNEKQLWNCLQMYKRQPHKLYVISQVGIELCKLHKNTQGELDLKNCLNLCKWWNRITVKNINYEFFFTANCEDRLEALILAKQVQLPGLPEYCSDFILELQRTYLKYLEIILKSWQPEITGTVLGMEDEEELGKECQNIINHITNTGDVLALINKLWPLVNYYHYEVFMVLLSTHSKLSLTKNILFEGYKQLLLFLKTYKRVSTPSRSEIEKWFGTFPMKAFIDPLSEIRLPLTKTFFSSDIWTIIKPEVNLETYKDWFKVVPILKPFLNENDICTYAINSALPTGISSSACTSWESYPKYDHLIATVDECAKNITDRERATAAIYNLMCNMTPGADKVRMAELSYKYAQIYRQTESGDDVEKVYCKVKQQYYNYSGMHILHKHQLAENKYLKLVANPVMLISALYEDPEIPQQIHGLHCNSAVNDAVDDLCTLFDLTAKKVKFGELLKFLKSNSTLDLDRDGETDSILRAYYICGGTDFRKPLLKIGMNKGDVENSMSVRANALKCFYYCSDISSLETMSEMSKEQFLAYKNKVSVMANLEDLGFKINGVAELDQLNKKLLKKLAHIDKPLAIKCIANICKIYGFDDLAYWKFIVNSAIQLNMIQDLCDYVEYLRFKCVTDFVQKAWNVIISDAFKTETNHLTALKLLQTCPVIYALNIEEYIKKCIYNERLEIAAVLLQYISTEKHEDYLKVIRARDNIVEKVAELENQVVGIGIALKILRS